MHSYVLELKDIFEQNADPAQAGPMKKYMRDQFEYLGIKSPQNAVLMRDFIKEHGLPQLDQLDLISRELWSLPQREFQYAAMTLISKLEQKLEPEFITAIEYLIMDKSWWDTVDLLASHAVGSQFKRFHKVKEKYLKKWRKSDNFWLRRTTLLFQLGYKKETDFDLLCEIVRENLGSDEFFINKAIGWALRQYAHTNPAPVKKFVKATKDLHPLSRREALKNIGE
ncbi:DNA alkylation repair protein [Candidatus Villigracilis saccharophilus]|uniref:DNA alkylation repair protein n=1 Tax=Candidatus Villigracilis saccharophilus TaxID=3140684 RepID=UPI003136FF1D|nr:DNA alkylation repair protein [Anaerolineales bacterium]